MNYTTGDLARITGATLHGDDSLRISTIEFDTRQLFSPTDTAFIALNTSKKSGEKYISDAVHRGIRVIITEHLPEKKGDISWLITENCFHFLRALAAFHLAQHKLRTIGITGSNGKTIVKEWLYQSISADCNTVKSPKSFNSQLGLPLSLLQIKPENTVGIFEAGISKPGEMDRLSSIFSPEIGVLTHIGSAHAANFKSKQHLITEKIELFRDSRTIIFNGDDAEVAAQIRKKYGDRELVTYGLKSHNNLFCKTLTSDPTILDLNIFGERWSLPVQKRDEATLTNALCVIAVMLQLGFKKEDILQRINQLKSVEMRLESLDGLRNNIIINDSYNLDLDSLRIAYQFVNQYQKKHKNLVLTDFVESRNPEKLYQDVADLTNQQQFRKIFLVGHEVTSHSNLFAGDTFCFDSTEELLGSTELNTIEDELILLKGARRFAIEKVKNHLELQKHDTVLEVNLNAIHHNINFHRTLLPRGTKIMAMVKAFSYGLGGYEIAEFLQHHHIDYLGVAYADEGAELRKHGITVPIMVMNPEQHSYSSIIEYGLEPEIYSLRVLDLFSSELAKHDIQKPYPVHLKVETGMNRLGFRADEIGVLLQELPKRNVEVRSVFSHLSSADDPAERDFTLLQLATFQEIADQISASLDYCPMRHILNSAGIVNYSRYAYDMVRIGIGMVGLSAKPEVQAHLRPVVKFKTVVSQISRVKAAESVGYNRRFKTTADRLIATLPVGYADGIARRVGNGAGYVGIRGKRFPVVGNVCMDMLMVDLGMEEIKEGEEVTIFNGNPSLQEFAVYCDTMPYEVLTSISRRVKRIYIKD